MRNASATADRRLPDSEAQLRRLAGALQTAREEERAALARELHDELGQTLTAIKLELTRMTDALRAESIKSGSVDRLQSLVGLVDVGVATVKRLATELRPPTLDHLGLADAIQWEAAAFSSRSGLRIHVAADADGQSLSIDQQTALFRIVQEALTNVARHAVASAVRVRLATTRRAFELRISDNGRGILPDEITNRGSIGLLGMRERAAQAGGVLDITGRPGKGTTVVVRVPRDRPRRRGRTMAAARRRR